MLICRSRNRYHTTSSSSISFTGFAFCSLPIIPFIGSLNTSSREQNNKKYKLKTSAKTFVTATMNAVTTNPIALSVKLSLKVMCNHCGRAAATITLCSKHLLSLFNPSTMIDNFMSSLLDDAQSSEYYL
jgi:hypothetical protein